MVVNLFLYFLHEIYRPFVPPPHYKMEFRNVLRKLHVVCRVLSASALSLFYKKKKKKKNNAQVYGTELNMITKIKKYIIVPHRGASVLSIQNPLADNSSSYSVKVLTYLEAEYPLQ